MNKEEIKYRVRHLTTYKYGGRVDLCHSRAHLSPLENDTQTVLSHHIDIDPAPDYQRERTDYFGNEMLYLSIQRSHDQLTLVSHFTVAVKSPKVVSTPVAWDAYPDLRLAEDEKGVLLADYLAPSVACPHFPELEMFLEPSLTPGRNLLELADEITHRIYTEFEYVPGATNTETPIQTALSTKQGVCQDFAHVMIAGMRFLGIPTRYVSGYLETVAPPGKKKLTGADASHAWVEIYVPDAGWVPFDPTNDRRCGEQHIKLAHGRDYFDVQPLRGIFLGSGEQGLKVEVDVERV